MTKTMNHLFYAVCAVVGLLAAIPVDVLDVLPAKWKPYVAGAVGAAMWVKAHRNLFVNPDGTPALSAWIKGDGRPQ